MTSHIKIPFSIPTLLVLLLSVACSSPGTGNLPDGGRLPDGGLATTPSALSNSPENNATGVATNASISVTFSEAMDPATLTLSTFTVTSGPSAAKVPGVVVYSNSKAFFRPAAPLASNTSFKATMSTGAKSVFGVGLAAQRTWTFTTGSMVGPELSVDLGGAGNFVVLAKSAISTVPTSAVTGNIGISPAAASYITEFALKADSTTQFSTSSQVTGKIYAANYGSPTPATLTTAVGDMETAFTDAAARAPSVTELGAGNIGGMTLAPGVYKWGTGLLIPVSITLNGSATDVWIFEIAKDLTASSGAQVTLTGGAVPKNVFWQVSGQVILGTTAHLEGVVLSKTSITLGTGASVKGRLFAQTAVALDGNIVVQPAP